MTTYVIQRNTDELMRYGVKGQKHGQRRYQNQDGSLTAEGREHYGIGQGNRYQNADGSLTKKGIKEQGRIEKFYDSNRGQKMMKSFERRGYTKADAYMNYRMTKSGLVGAWLGGVGGALIGSAVTSKRLNAGRDFVSSTIQGLVDHDKQRG